MFRKGEYFVLRAQEVLRSITLSAFGRAIWNMSQVFLAAIHQCEIFTDILSF